MFEQLATDADLLGAVRAQRTIADQAEVQILQLACEWADAHPATDLEAVATYVIPGGDQPWTIAGPGCPMIAEFAVTEFATAIGLGTESGEHLIGQALELRHRLPKIWDRVRAGEVQAWRARRIAEATLQLSPEAAAHVDRHLAPFAHSAKPWQLDRLVDDAIARHMPDLAADRRQDALDRRHVRIDTNPMSMAGTAFLTGELDLIDAHDLEHALRAGADALKAAGSEDSLDVRRSIALGDLARGHQSLDLGSPDVEVPATPPRPQQRILLHLHLSDAATTGWVEQHRLPVTTDTIKEWVGRPDVNLWHSPTGLTFIRDHHGTTDHTHHRTQHRRR